ncbi:MAG: hypothetical protein E7013_00635 [Alphaproteobacteria bacterium]|nr:hypothetical protein [Alphaproteobacteria bacterium]
MYDAVDNFIMCETNKVDKITVAILASALIYQKKDATPEDVADIFSMVYMKLKERKLITFP